MSKVTPWQVSRTEIIHYPQHNKQNSNITKESIFSFSGQTETFFLYFQFRFMILDIWSAIDIANAFFSIPLAAECKQLLFCCVRHFLISHQKKAIEPNTFHEIMELHHWFKHPLYLNTVTTKAHSLQVQYGHKSHPKYYFCTSNINPSKPLTKQASSSTLIEIRKLSGPRKFRQQKCEF